MLSLGVRDTYASSDKHPLFLLYVCFEIVPYIPFGIVILFNPLSSAKLRIFILLTSLVHTTLVHSFPFFKSFVDFEADENGWRPPRKLVVRCAFFAYAFCSSVRGTRWCTLSVNKPLNYQRLGNWFYKLSFPTLILLPNTSVPNPMKLQILFLVVCGIVFGIWRLGQIQMQLHYPSCLGVLTVEISKLSQVSMAENTWHTYRSPCASFNQFRYLFRLPLNWPSPLDQIVNFIVYMSMQGQAHWALQVIYRLVWKTLIFIHMITIN